MINIYFFLSEDVFNKINFIPFKSILKNIVNDFFKHMLILLQYTPVRSSWGAIGTKMAIYQVPAVNKNKIYKLVYNCMKLFFFIQMFWTLDESSVECHHSTPSLTIASSTVPACKPPIVYHGGESKSNKKQ